MENDKLLHPWEAAQMMGVSIKTLSRWAKAGKVPFIKTLGGHRRYKRAAITALINSE